MSSVGPYEGRRSQRCKVQDNSPVDFSGANKYDSFMSTKNMPRRKPQSAIIRFLEATPSQAMRLLRTYDKWASKSYPLGRKYKGGDGRIRRRQPLNKKEVVRHQVELKDLVLKLIMARAFSNRPHRTRVARIVEELNDMLRQLGPRVPRVHYSGRGYFKDDRRRGLIVQMPTGAIDHQYKREHYDWLADALVSGVVLEVCRGPECTRIFEQNGVGRPKTFCSPRCRDAHHNAKPEKRSMKRDLARRRRGEGILSYHT